MTHLRIILDTNVLISGLLFSGPPHLIIKQILTGKYRLHTSADLVAELDYVLKSKFPNSRAACADTLEAIKHIAHLAVPHQRIDIIKDGPDDNRILECAVSAEADIIISGDKHLLNIKSFRHIPVISPSEFLKRYSLS